MAQRNDLYPDTFVRGIEALGVKPVPVLVGPMYAQLKTEVARIKKYRNKLMHGQATGQAIQSRQLGEDVKWLIEWVNALAVGADTEFGYDGLRRNTFKAAKASANISVATYPFTSPATFRTWLKTV